MKLSWHQHKWVWIAGRWGYTVHDINDDIGSRIGGSWAEQQKCKSFFCKKKRVRRVESVQGSKREYLWMEW